MGFWVLVFIALVLVAVWPAWPYSGRWGYAPGFVLLLLLVFWLLLIWFGFVLFAWPWTPAPVPDGVPPA